jgi:Zn-dependent metalloprotease
MRRRLGYAIIIAIFHLLFVSAGFSATKVYLPDATETLAQLNQVQALSDAVLETKLGLTPQESLALLKQRTDLNNITHLRYNQLFNGMPIWGYHVLVARNSAGKVISLHGTKISDIADDIPMAALSSSTITALGALSKMKARHIEKSQMIDQAWVFDNEVSKKVIYIDDYDQARWMP